VFQALLGFLQDHQFQDFLGFQNQPHHLRKLGYDQGFLDEHFLLDFLVMDLL
jgi:hypothetical protein